MEYVSEGTEGQWKDPEKRPSAKSLAPKSPGEQTETGQQIKGALSGIGQGLAALFSEKPSAPQQERPVLPMTWKGPNGRSQGSRGHFDAGHT
jgi:hypothetical protein